MEDKICMSILFIGLDGSGKTTLLRQISQNLYREIFPTAGFEIHYLNNMQKLPAPVLVYDCSGQGRNRENWKTFYEVVDGIGFVIDLDDNDRLKFVKRYLDEVLSDPQVQKKCLPIHLFLNKSDIETRVDSESLKQFLELDQKQRKYKNPINWKEISAFKYNQNEVEECFFWLKNNRYRKQINQNE